MTGRYVFDTNAILSALLLPKSKPHQAFDKARQGGILLVSEEVIEELNDVLRREDFEKMLPKHCGSSFWRLY
jgi:predicted nucleic acid-binding protein